MDIEKIKIAIDTGDLQRAKTELDKVEKSAKSVDKSVGGLTNSMMSFKGVVATVATSAVISNYIKMADTFTSIESKLKLATKSTNEFSTAQRELFLVAQESRVAFESTVDLYSKLAISTENLKLKQSDLLRVTETINKSGLIGGGSKEGINAALVQLGQGFASGTLRGEELNSVMEQTPRLAKAIAEGMGDDVLTECNGCFGSLSDCNRLLKDNAAKKEEINGILAETTDKQFEGTTNVRHLAEFLYNDIGLDKLQSMFTKSLNLNVAVHYGCHFLKPTAELHIEESAENPTILDELVEVTGAKSVPYAEKMMCCGSGGGLRSRDKDVTTSYTYEKLQNMDAAGVDCIIDICPFCHLQFDVGQKEVNEKYGTNFDIPVFHLAQLYGLAMGLSADELTLDAQIIDSDPVLKKLVAEADNQIAE